MEVATVTTTAKANRLNVVEFIHKTLDISQDDANRLMDLTETTTAQDVIFSDTNIIEAKILQILNLQCFLPVVLLENIDRKPHNKEAARLRTVIQIRTLSQLYVFNFYDGKSYRIPENTPIGIVGFYLTNSAPLGLYHKEFYNDISANNSNWVRTLLEYRDIPGTFNKLNPEYVGAAKNTARFIMGDQANTMVGGDGADKPPVAARIETANIMYLLTDIKNPDAFITDLWDYARALYHEFGTYRTPQRAHHEITPYENIAYPLSTSWITLLDTVSANQLIALMGTGVKASQGNQTPDATGGKRATDAGSSIPGLDADSLAIFRTRNKNISSFVTAKQQREKNNYNQALLRFMYIKTYGLAEFDRLNLGYVGESPALADPILRDISGRVSHKTYKNLSKMVENYQTKSAVARALLVKNKTILRLASTIRNTKFPDDRELAMRELLRLAGIKEYREWLVIDGIKVLCEHYLSLVRSEKRGLTPEAIAAQLGRYADSLDTENEGGVQFCKICSAKLDYIQRNTDHITLPTTESVYNNDPDEVYKILNGVCSQWVGSYLVANFSDTRGAMNRVVRGIIDVLHGYMRTIYRKLNLQKNVDSQITTAKFLVYVNVYVAAVLAKITIDNSKIFKIYGAENNERSIREQLLRALLQVAHGPHFTPEEVSNAFKKAVINMDKLITNMKYRDKKPSEQNFNPVDIEINRDTFGQTNKPFKQTNNLPDKPPDKPHTQSPERRVVAEPLATIRYLVNTYAKEYLFSPVTESGEKSGDVTHITYTEQYAKFLNMAQGVAQKIAEYNRPGFNAVLNATTLAYRVELNFTTFLQLKMDRHLEILHGAADNSGNLGRIATNKSASPGKSKAVTPDGHTGNGTDKNTSSMLHYHKWEIPVYAKYADVPRWRGVPGGVFTTGKPGDHDLLAYTCVDVLCGICGTAYTYSYEKNLDNLVQDAIHRASFNKYAKYMCPVTGVAHVYTGKPSTCRNCGFAQGSSVITDTYYNKYQKVYHKNLLLQRGGVTDTHAHTVITPKPLTDTSDVNINEFVTLTGNRQIAHTLAVLGGTETRTATDIANVKTPEELGFDIPRFNKLKDYTRYLTVQLERIKSGKRLGNYNSKYADIKYRPTADAKTQYNLLLGYLFILAKTDKALFTEILDYFSELDKKSCKISRSKLAQVEAISDINSADTSHIDYVNSDVDVVDIKAVNLFSFDHMDYNGENEPD